MAWPTPQDYNEAVQSPQSSFSDPELKAGQVETNKLGLPRPISGRFAVVYNMRCGPRNVAIRCFQSEVPDQQERYAAISEHLKKSRLPYTVDFDFQRNGVLVRGKWFPILKMEWVGGEPLHTYVEKHLRDPAALMRLATDWVVMTEALRKAAIAHGDLQDGNVLVAKGGLKLIDYDGMFVPALAGRSSNETGHRNYQHPNRTALDYGPYLDNFSDWVIYVSLAALIIDPSLWARLRGGDECLLFRKEDFDPSGKSQALATLTQHADPRLQNLGTLFSSVLYLMPASVPPLASGGALDPAILKEQALSLPQANPSGGDWLNDYVKPPSKGGSQSMPTPPAPTTAPLPTASPAWILDLIAPVAARRSFEQPLLRLRLTLVVLLAMILALPLLGSASADLIGEALLLAVLGTLPFLSYRREPIVQERAACLRREREEGTALEALQRRIRDQDSSVARLRDEEKKVKATVEKEREATRQNEQRARQRASAEMKSQMDAFNARQQNLNHPLMKLQADYQAGVGRSNQQVAACNQQQVQELNTVLQPLQRQFVQDYLRNARIDTARIHGIGPQMVANLRAFGFTTAADVTWGVQNVSGIGNSKASALMGWRQAVENEARLRMPTSLSQGQQYSIVAKYDSQRRAIEQQAMTAKAQFEAQERTLRQQSASAMAGIDAERARAQQQFTQQTQGITVQYEAEYRKLSQREAALTTEYAKKVAEVERQIGETRKGIYDQNWKLAKARQELEVYQAATFIAYLAVLLRVRRTAASSPNAGP